MNYSTTLSGDEATGLMAGLLGLSLVSICLLSIFIWVLFVIGYWKMFTKAGEPGWKSIIPIYHHYVAFRLAWQDGTKHFWIWFIATLLTSICSACTSGSGTSGEGSILLGLVTLVVAIVALVWSIRFYFKLARAYNKGTGCAILSIFFWNIMTLYYGFSSTATYQGPQE